MHAWTTADAVRFNLPMYRLSSLEANRHHRISETVRVIDRSEELVAVRAAISSARNVSARAVAIESIEGDLDEVGFAFRRGAGWHTRWYSRNLMRQMYAAVRVRISTD